MQKDLFKKGFKQMENEVKQKEKEKESSKGSLYRFSLKEKDGEVPIRILTDEPLSFNEHSWQDTQGRYHTELCTGQGCAYCADGMKSRFVSAFLVVDGREYERKVWVDNKPTDKTELVDFSVKVLVRGTKDAVRLSNLDKKYGLANVLLVASRTGSGTSTVYQFDKEDEVNKEGAIWEKGELSDEAIKEIYAVLPPKYKGMSFDDILMSQFADTEEEEAEEVEEVKVKRTVARKGV